MTRHLDAEEIAQLRGWLGQKKSPIEIWKLHKKARRELRVKPLSLTALRKALKGKTHRGAQVETRGRKRSLAPRAIAALDKKRKELVKKCDGDREVPWHEVIKKARVTKVDPTTAKRALVDAGIDVASRRPREKPERKAEHIEERIMKCGKWRFLRKDYFSEKVDLIIDNKHYDVPTSQEARKFLGKMKVRRQIRTRAEGLLPQYTKPNEKRNRKNLGGTLSVCAGIHKDRVVLWKYLDPKWNGAAAAKLYENDIQKVLRRLGPFGRKPVIVEDNDPVGYKSSKARIVKKKLGFNIVSLPRYSPDLNPLDFFLWNDIGRRMRKCDPKTKKESVKTYKVRLRKVAMSTSKVLIRKALATMHKRIAAIYKAKGQNIEMD